MTVKALAAGQTKRIQSSGLATGDRLMRTGTATATSVLKTTSTPHCAETGTAKAKRKSTSSRRPCYLSCSAWWFRCYCTCAGAGSIGFDGKRRSGGDSWAKQGPHGSRAECSHLRETLRAIVAARVPFLVTGGTGTGKSTLLAAMLAQAPPEERIVVVEDVLELAVDHPHVVHLQARHANSEGAGAVDLTALVRQSLRMRPDRIVLGECRGEEIRELLQALNTGHDGGCGTVHANAASDVVSRMEALGALAGMTPAAVHAQLASAIQVVLHMARRPDGSRTLAEVAVLDRSSSGLRTVPALSGGAGAWAEGPGWPRLTTLLDGGPQHPDGGATA